MTERKTHETGDLRIALFSGNYNYVRDGVNQALNRLVAYLLSSGAAVRIYSPTTDAPAFPPTGDLVSVPSWKVPGRGDYRLARGLPAQIRRDIEAFSPNCVHVSAPDVLGHRAVSLARSRNIPVIASMHTLFETYPAYYGLGFLEAPAVAIIRRFYNRCDAVVAPTDDIIDRLRGQGVVRPMSVWARGVDHQQFNPGRRDLAWRRSLGIGDDEFVIGFIGRVVLEKGLDIFAAVSAELRVRGIAHRVLVIGEGLAQDWFAEHVPGAVFSGFQMGVDLGRAVASLDVFLNPSVTETFGNVTLEAMAAGVPVVAADATGARSLVIDGVTGRLLPPRDVNAYADAIQHYATSQDDLRAAGAAGVAEAGKYHWDAINQKVVDTYFRAIAMHAR